MSGGSSSRVFISYRRRETSGLAGRLYDRLAVRFGDDQVFMDVDAIALGVDFAEVITQAVSTCEVLLAVIGPGWLTATDEDGRRRLDDPDDLVRLEITAALDRNIRVIPILVEGAVMPRRHKLPDNLARLARRNALTLRHESFRADADRLIRAIEPILRTGMAVGPDSPAPTPHGAEQIEAKPPGSSPTRLDERQFLRSLDNHEYREALRGLFETAKAVGMVFEWGSVGSSIRLHAPDRDEPLTVAWVFPDRAGWSGLRHLTLGYDTGSAKNTPSVQDALSEYVDAVRLVPGAMRAKARALQAYTFAPEAVRAQQEQLARLLRQLSRRAQDSRHSRLDPAATDAARVLVHQAFFIGAKAGASPYYFVKVTNLLQSRDIEVTHVWFDADPPVHLVLRERPLPARLQPNETWEGWVDAAAVAHVADVERSARVRLSDGTTIKSRPNTDVPPIGYVAGPGSHEGGTVRPAGHLG
jgi:TIR domain